MFWYLRCEVPDLKNDTYDLQGDWQEVLLNRSIPWTTNDDGEPEYDSCEIYFTNEKTVYNSLNIPINNSKGECDSWVYDQSVFKSTFITKVHVHILLFFSFWAAAVSAENWQTNLTLRY